MTNEQKSKLEVIMNFLNDNKIAFHPQYNGKANVTPDLYVPKHKIMVKVSEGKESDDEFFMKVRRRYHPLFIRDNDTREFVLEKIQNLIIDIMKRNHALYSKSKSK